MQCDPSQCRQNKLYPGIAIKSRFSKGTDQRKWDRKDGSPNEVSELSNGIPAKEPCHEGHPLKRVKAFSSLSQNLPNVAALLEDGQTPPQGQDCRRPGSNPNLGREGIDTFLGSVDNPNSSLKDMILLGSAKDPTPDLASKTLHSSPDSQRVSQGTKLFPSVNSMDISLELDPTTVRQFSLEDYVDFRRNWPSADETFVADKFDWIEDLMASDLPSLEYDWPREEGVATATLTDISSSPNTLLDFDHVFGPSFSSSGMDDLLGDSQNSQFEMNQQFTYAPLIQYTGIHNGCVDKLANELEADRTQGFAPFILPSTYGLSLGSQADSIPEPKDEEYGHLIDAAFPSPDTGFFNAALEAEKSVRVPGFAKANRFNEASRPLPTHSRVADESPEHVSLPRSRPKAYFQTFSVSNHSKPQYAPINGPVHELSESNRYFYSMQLPTKSMLIPHRGLPRRAAMSIPQPTQNPPTPHQLPVSPQQWQGSEEPIRNWLADKVEDDKGGQDEDEAIQVSLRSEQRKTDPKFSRISLSGGIPPHPEKTVISIEDLTILLRDSYLILIEPTEQVYCPKDEPSLVDVILLDNADRKSTPALNLNAFVDVLQTARSKVRLVHSVCSIDVENRKTSSDQNSPGTVPPAS